MKLGAAVDGLNALALLATLTIAMLASGYQGRGGPEPAPPRLRGLSLERVERGPDGKPALRDARSVLVPLLDYRRIASGTLVADRALADLCEPERVVAFSRYARNTPLSHRYAGKPSLGARDDVEQVLRLKPDLLILSDLVDASYIARVEEQGIHVFVLHPMTGLHSLFDELHNIGLLLGAGERAASYAATLEQRMHNVAARSEARRARALYLSIYGDKLFAAAADTSYHDVIEYAGLLDAGGAAGLHGWPELSSEQVLTLAPDVILTRTGMTGPLCRHPGLELLAACRDPRRIIALDGALLDDPGPAMLEAAEALHDANLSRTLRR